MCEIVERKQMNLKMICNSKSFLNLNILFFNVWLCKFEKDKDLSFWYGGLFTDVTFNNLMFLNTQYQFISFFLVKIFYLNCVFTYKWYFNRCDNFQTEYIYVELIFDVGHVGRRIIEFIWQPLILLNVFF